MHPSKACVISSSSLHKTQTRIYHSRCPSLDFLFWCEILHCCEYLEKNLLQIQVLFKKQKFDLFAPKKMFKIASFLQTVQVGS